MENYRRLLENFPWRSWEQHVAGEGEELSRDAQLLARAGEKLRESIMSHPDAASKIRRVDPKKLQWAYGVLSSGEVYGVDGTLSMYPTPLGYWCRIAVVAVNYAGERLSEAVYVSDAHLVDRGLGEVWKLLENVEEVVRYSPLLYRSIMMYKEREVVAERVDGWRLIHGPLVPLEMRLGWLGVSGALEANLELAARLIEDGRVAGVLSSTRRLRLANLGYALKPGEYIVVTTLGRLIEAERRSLPPEEESLLMDFARDHGEKVAIGVYRASRKAYVFEACSERLDELIHIVVADSLSNGAKGFPLLLDYADRLCRSLFKAEEFQSRIEYELLKEEGEEAFMAIDERRMRW